MAPPCQNNAMGEQQHNCGLLRKSVRSNNFFRQNSQDDMQDRAAYVCHGQELDYIIYIFI